GDRHRPGAGVLARSLAPRPQRADAPARHGPPARGAARGAVAGAPVPRAAGARTRTASVVVPGRDGERYLEELLAALADQSPDEVLVIDSGSRDRSVQIARAAGVELLAIAPAQFGHGRTRNLGAERTSGELICFLTQDATPLPGWLDSLRE